MTVREMKHAALAEQWTANIIDCRQSGLSVAAWCEEHQVNKSTYYKWERKLLTEVGPREKQTHRELRGSELPVQPLWNWQFQARRSPQWTHLGRQLALCRMLC